MEYKNYANNQSVRNVVRRNELYEKRKAKKRRGNERNNPKFRNY